MPPRPIVYAEKALSELDQIFDWNTRTYGSAHAYSYIEFLTDRIHRLASKSDFGRPVPNRDDLRYQVIRRGKKGHGHIVIFRVDDNQVLVVHIFHTAQDWTTIITEES